MAKILPSKTTAIEKMLSKNKLFVLALLLLLLIVGIVAKSNINFRVTATIGLQVAPLSKQTEPPKIKAHLPFEAIQTGDDWLIQEFL